jgi:hypothetical protein
MFMDVVMISNGHAVNTKEVLNYSSFFSVPVTPNLVRRASVKRFVSVQFFTLR